MSHLLAIAVGPVQEFIAAARRTRDLCLGSLLLSEISRAVAQAVEAQGGTLIFPASADAENIANVILAKLPTGEPGEVAAKAKQAAQECWMKFVKDAWSQAKAGIREEIWDEQKEDVIEFYAAWVAQKGSYTEDRRRVMRLLAGRKNCREFIAARGRAGVPKSSLDGQRESVLKDPAKEVWPEHFRAKCRIREGEQLDVVGVVKRSAEGNKPYPSVSRIAADPWVRGRCIDELNELKSECERLGKQVIRPINLHEVQGHRHFEAFPYEGTAIYLSRHHELVEETEIDIEKLAGIREALKGLPEPNPYLAVLVADGDQMGAAISALTSDDANRSFSQSLAGFAGEARKIVNAHSGVLVYAGGDDVLAFLPVDKCLECARELRTKFIECLRPQVPVETPTLSVGVAIGHFMENLEDLLDYGRAAEKAAKKIQGKDALAVHLHKRGGAPIETRGKWSESHPLDIKLAHFARLMNDGIIPAKLPYELRAMATLYEAWGENAAAAIKVDLMRLIAKKQSRGVETVQGQLGEYLELMDAKKLLAFANELLVARLIATVMQQAVKEQP